MTHRKTKRILALVLLAAFIIGGIPTVFATEATEPVADPEPLPAETSPEPTTEPESSAEPEVSEEPTEEPEVPRSDDGETLTRATINPKARAKTGTMTKDTCVYFSAYVSDYWYCNQYYTGTGHTGGHYFYTEAIAYHYIDGELSYCIEPNTSSVAGQKYTSYTSDGAATDSYWMVELDATQRELIQQVLAFSYPEVDYGYGEQAQYAAAQTIIWEIIMRDRYPDLDSTSDAGLYNKIAAALGTNYTSAYRAILDGISIYDGRHPSFASDNDSSIPTVELTLNTATNCYEGSVTDGNAVLSRYTFALDGVTLTRSGNTLKISVPASSASSVKGKTVIGTSTQRDMDTSDPMIWENSTYQTVVSAGGAEYAQAYFKLDWEDTGGIKIIKKVSDSSVSVKGWTFYFKNNRTGETITKTTDSNGNITVTGLAAGTKYAVSEKAVDGYYNVPSQTVTIEAGKTTELTFTNKPLVGNLTVSKAVNYGTWTGFKFRLYGTSTIGKAVDVTVTTGEDGTATFSGIYVGTYMLEEISPGDQYIAPAAQTVTITANATSGAGYTAKATVTNTWKHWRATVTKVDAETTTKQGNSTLDGAEYTLYKSGKAVATYTVSNGKFTTEYFPCTESDSVYTLKETKAPEGYTLDETVYKLTTSYSHYAKAENTFTVTVSDTVIKGKIQVEKYALNTVSDEDTPEKGATFLVWLKSAGSYAKAKNTEKCQITIGENGIGASKDLPYGTYCITQLSGWEGYDMDDTVYEVKITEDGKTVTVDTAKNPLKIYNDIWTGTLSICKVDKDSKTPLDGAKFTLTGSDGSKQELTTGEDGKVVFENLVYGVTYTWTETEAPKGYLLNKDNTGTWSVGKQNDSIEITCENERRPGSMVVTKTNANGEPLFGCTFLLEYLEGDTWKPVFQNTSKAIVAGGCSTSGIKDGCLTTGETGTVTFSGLLADSEIQYRLTEVAAPEGYTLLTEPVYEGTLPVEVDENKAADGADEIIDGTAYFYCLPISVRDGHIYVLPQTGGSGVPLVPMALLVMAFGTCLCISAMKPWWYRKLCRNIKKLYRN